MLELISFMDFIKLFDFVCFRIDLAKISNLLLKHILVLSQNRILILISVVINNHLLLESDIIHVA